MTTHTPAPRRRRAPALLLAALMALFMVVAVSPSYADIYEDNGGKPGTRNYNTGGPGTGEFEHHCDAAGNLVRDGYGVVFTGPHISCMEPGWKRTDTFALCQPSMQVFRFYGTVKRPVIGWSTSMVAQSNWCSPLEAHMWSTSAYDVQNRLTMDNFDREALNGVAEPDLGHEPESDSLNARGLNMHPMYALRWTLRDAPKRIITAGRPFDGNRNCAAAQYGNPYKALLDNPETPEKLKHDILVSLRDALVAETENFEKDLNVGPVAALRAAQKLTGVKFANVNQGTAEFETRRCASAMQYVSTADLDNMDKPAEQAKYRVTGVCYIPVEHLAHAWESDKSGETKEAWSWPSLINQKTGGGMRYSDYYKDTKHTRGNFQDQDPDLKNEYEKAVLDAWRNQMGKWYQGRTGPRIASLWNGKGVQIIPAQPFPTLERASRVPDMPAIDKMEMYDRAAARAALEDYSRCNFGPHFHSSPEIEPEQVEPQANLVVENQAVQKAGGYGAGEQGFTVIDRGLTCDDSSRCVGRDIVFKQLTYNVVVAAPDGWNLRHTEESANRPTNDIDAEFWTNGPTAGAPSCSGNVCTIPVKATYSGSQLRVSTRYFRPTMPGEKVRVTVKDVQVQFVQVIDITEVWYSRGPNNEVVRHTRTYSEYEDVSLDNIDVTGNPVPLQRGGGRFWYDMRVVGATSVR